MKKISFIMSVALAGLFSTACTEDYTDWADQPAQYTAESAVTIPGFTATATGAVDLNAIEETADLLTLSQAALPEGFTVKDIRAMIVPADAADGTEPVEVAADADGKFAKADLQAIIEEAYGKRPVNRVFNAHIYADAVKNGQAVLIDAGTIQLNLTPEAPQISQNYYLVGGPQDWAASATGKTQKFSHSGKDVYEDAIFTIVINVDEASDTWFAIGDDEACEAIGNGDWSKLLGTVDGNGQNGMTGKLDVRSNLKDDGSLCVPAGNKLLKITLDMMAYTFTIEAVNISENYYLIGGPGNWDSSKNQKFSHSDMNVIDDPVFTYVFESTGSEMWFAFGDDEAIDAVGEGTWNKLFGTKGESTDLSGSFDYRYNLDGDHSFCVDGAAKFYRFQVDMMNFTYTITPLNFQEYIYEAGVNNSWGGIQQPLYCPDGNGTYTGYFYAKEDSWTDGRGAFKFRGSADGWDNGNYGAGTSSDEGGTLIDDGGSDNLFATPGFYRADVNLADMTYTLTPIRSVFVVGSAINNDWDTGIEMTYNTDELCWECDATLNGDVIKFKGNGTWDSADGNWGGTMDNIINGSNDNIPVNISGNVHIKFYPLCDTRSYCTIEAR